MKKILLLVFMLPFAGISQIKTSYVLLELKIIDSETKNPVKYTKVYDKDNTENISTTNTDALTFDDENFGKVVHLVIECEGYETVIISLDFTNFKYNVKLDGYDQEVITVEVPEKKVEKDLSFLVQEPLTKISFKKEGKNNLSVIYDQAYATQMLNKIKNAPAIIKTEIAESIKGKLIFSGKIKNHFVDTIPLQDVRVELFKNDSLMETVYSEPNGKYTLMPVPVRGYYKIKYSRSDLVSKFLIIDTRNLPEENSLGNRPLDLSPGLFRSSAHCDFSFLDTTPVITATYSRATDEIDLDMNALQEVKTKINNLLKSCQ